MSVVHTTSVRAHRMFCCLVRASGASQLFARPYSAERPCSPARADHRAQALRHLKTSQHKCTAHAVGHRRRAVHHQKLSLGNLALQMISERILCIQKREMAIHRMTHFVPRRCRPCLPPSDSWSLVLCDWVGFLSEEVTGFCRCRLSSLTTSKKALSTLTQFLAEASTNSHPSSFARA